MARIKPWRPVLQGGHPLAHGLVGAWLFAERGGTATRDTSGYTNTGTLTNGPVWGTGLFGPHLTFAAASSRYVSIGNVSSVDMSSTAGFTLSAWIRFTNTGSYKEIIGKGVNTDYEIMVDNGQKILFSNNAGGYKQMLSVATISVNTWYHIAGVKSYADTTGRIYINGVLNATSTSMGGAAANSSNPLLIGARTTGTPTLFFNGDIAGAMVWNRPLTARDVATLYADHWAMVRPRYRVLGKAIAVSPSITPTVGAGTLTGQAGYMDFGIPVPTEI